MLLPVDLMSIASAGSGATYVREASPDDSSPAPSWLLTADTDLSEQSGNDLINQIFMSYTEDGEANPETRFAADLKELLHAHGITLPPDRSLLANVVSMASGKQNGDSSELTWSVDELLQMSMPPLSGGNNLPLDDQSLPSVLNNWLAALTTDSANSSTSADANALKPDSALSTLLGGSVAVGSLATGGGEADPTALATVAQPVGAALTGATAGSQPEGLPANVAGGLSAGGSDGAARDAEPTGPIVLTRTTAGGNPAADQDIAARAALMDDAARRTAESAQLNPGAQKVSADAGNASVFRSIQFSPSGNGESAGNNTALAGNLADQGRSGTLQERIQAIIAGQPGASLTPGSSEVSASTGSSQPFNPADGSAVVNRPEQRMFATETAQQAHSQAAQHTANRTADGLPRFAMDTAFGQQGWSDSLGRQLLVMNSQGVSSAQIRLDPPELGSLTVKIQMSSDQQASVSFVSQHAVVREALEQQLNRLQDLFKDQGLNLQDVSVSDQSPQQRGGEERGRQDTGRDNGTGEHETHAAEPVFVRSESLIDFYA